MNLCQPIKIAVILIAAGSIGAADQPSFVTGQETSDRTIGTLIRRQFIEILLAGGQEEIGDDDPLGLELVPSPDFGTPDSQTSDSQTSDSQTSDSQTPESGLDRLLQPSDESTWDRQEESDNSEAEQRLDSLRARIGALQRPVTEIAIRATADGIVPEDRASQSTFDEPTIAITALEIGPPEPNRYTVCFMHRPLYYEQRNLERCGNGFGCLQNAVSGGQFLCNTLLLPYHLGQQRCDCAVPAGGDCKCCQSYPLTCDECPPSLLGLTKQAAAVAGFTFLLL